MDPLEPMKALGRGTGEAPGLPIAASGEVATSAEAAMKGHVGGNQATGGQAGPTAALASWLVRLLQTGDSFYPTGGYAHSFGLEGLVQEGVVRDRATLRRFLFQSTLPGLRHAELPIAAHAWRAFGGPDWEAVGELCRLSSGLKSARETRAASESIGRQRAELAAGLEGSVLAREYLQRATAEAWPCALPVSAALEGRCGGIPIAAVLAGIYYGSVAALLSAAMKLLRLGQNGAQSLLTEALSAAPEIITAAELTPLDQIGWFNPWLDIAAARHETAEARMFMS